MSVLPVGIAASGDEGYTIEDSLRFRSSASAYLDWTPASAGNRKTWTWSGWVKRGNFGSYQVLFGAGSSTSNRLHIRLDVDALYVFEVASGSTIDNVGTTAVFRDPSAWYHIVVTYDSTEATASNRIKIYINGTLQTALAATNYPSLNWNGFVNATSGSHLLGVSAGSTQYFDGYLTEVNFIDGQALTADDFGEFDGATGVWKPKAYTGTYGTNGFYLPMTATTQAELQNTVLYTGNGSTQSISGFGFSPDLVWIKNRSSAYSHQLYDTVRGATQKLSSDSTNAENTRSNALTSFDSDGFTTGSEVNTNGSGNSIVAWGWDAGDGSPVTNTDGTITSTVKANDATGFSIVSYTGNGTTGATVGHGLSTTPSMVIVKDRDGVTNWRTFHSSLTSGKTVYLNTTAGESTDNDYISTVSSTTFTLSTTGGTGVNYTGRNHIAYCFSEVSGVSKFGSYTGTGVAGNSVTGLGFRPAWVMYKRANSTGNWTIHDLTRDPSNQGTERLYPNLSNAEQTVTGDITFDADGFTLDGTGSDSNANGSTYIYMAFADTRDAQFNFDASGNKNNWTANNINSNASSESSYDIMTDVPTLTDEDNANFCTLNPLWKSSNTVIQQGNLYLPGASYPSNTVGTIAVSSGKWYFEATVENNYGSYNSFGIATTDSTDWLTTATNNNGTIDWNQLSKIWIDGTNSGNTTINLYNTSTKTVMCAFDLDNNYVWFGGNGTWTNSGDPANGTNGFSIPSSMQGKFFTPLLGSNKASVNANTYVNFGQRPFAYTPPTGFKKLNTYNLPDATIEDGSKQFNTVLYTGTAADRSVTGVGFQPDFTWLKTRNVVGNNVLFDSNRGALKELYSNTTGTESAETNGLDYWESDGFHLKSVRWNDTSTNYVAWNWKANGSGVSNTVGSIPSTVSANTTAGFSIVSYTGNGSAGATIGHGLGVAPGIIIVKNRDGVYHWIVQHTSLGATKYLTLSTTDAAATSSAAWNNTAPTSSVFSLGTSSLSNRSADDMVAYCFAPVEGFSAFGSYTGNGSTDGPFIYTGFRPAWVLIKRTNTTGNWVIFDAVRNTYNVVNNNLNPDSSSAENVEAPASTHLIDFTSNGFKLKGAGGAINSSGSTYIYAAFAENPFKNSLAR